MARREMPADGAALEARELPFQRAWLPPIVHSSAKFRSSSRPAKDRPAASRGASPTFCTTWDSRAALSMWPGPTRPPSIGSRCTVRSLAHRSTRGSISKQRRAFVRSHAADLTRVPSAFVSVSLSAASKNAKEIEAAEKLARAFPVSCGWTPARIASVAGRLAYREYGFFIRWVMKRIAKKEGAPTDTSRDYELTNWEEVDELAREMASRIRAKGSGRLNEKRAGPWTRPCVNPRPKAGLVMDHGDLELPELRDHVLGRRRRVAPSSRCTRSCRSLSM